MSSGQKHICGKRLHKHHLCVPVHSLILCLPIGSDSMIKHPRFDNVPQRSLVIFGDLCEKAFYPVEVQELNDLLDGKQNSIAEALWMNALEENGFQLPAQQVNTKDLFDLVKSAFEHKFQCTLNTEFVSMYIASANGRTPVRHDDSSRAFTTGEMVYVDRLLTHYLFEYVANYYIWSRFYEDKKIYAFCFQYAINSLDKCYRQGYLNSDINVASLIKMIKEKCDDRGLQFIADMYWSVLSFAMCHELAHVYMAEKSIEHGNSSNNELHADRIGYEVYLSIIDHQISGLTSPFLAVFHDYLYAAPIVLFLFYEDLYFMSNWLYGEKPSADTHPTFAERKKQLLEISESEEYIFDTVQGNDVLCAFWEISDQFREELFYKLKNGKLTKLIQGGYMDMRNREGSDNALAFDSKVQKKLLNFAGKEHLDTNKLLGLYNIAVEYTVQGKVNSQDLVHTNSDGKIVSTKGYNVRFRLKHALATIIDIGVSLTDGMPWKTVAVLLKILLTVADVVEVELTDIHAKVLETCFELGASVREIPEAVILEETGAGTYVIDDLIKLHCISLEDGKIKLIEVIDL